MLLLFIILLFLICVSRLLLDIELEKFGLGEGSVRKIPDEELMKAENYGYYTVTNNVNKVYDLLNFTTDKFTQFGHKKYISDDGIKSKKCVNTSWNDGPACCSGRFNPLNLTDCDRCVIRCAGDYKNVGEWLTDKKYYDHRDACFAACNYDKYEEEYDIDEFREEIHRQLEGIEPLDLTKIRNYYDWEDNELATENARRVMRSIGCHRIFSKPGEFYYWNNELERCTKGEPIVEPEQQYHHIALSGETG